jgi:hypothetical protein
MDKRLVNFLIKRGISIIHKDVYESFPFSDAGILSFVTPFIPVSYFGPLKNVIINKNKKYFENKREVWKAQIDKIWNEELEIIIVYKIGSKYDFTDVDNLNKFMIDSMKGVLFENDNKIKLILGRKDRLSVSEYRAQHLEKAIVRIDLFKNSKINRTLNELFEHNMHKKK